MNLSYVRLQAVKAVALPSFCTWLGLPELEPPVTVRWDKAIDAATEAGAWRGAAFFVYVKEGWTVFEDITGYLGAKSTQDWLELAGAGALVFAGYNDSVPYAQLTAILGGRVVREFQDDRQDPTRNVNRGRLDFESDAPIVSWVEAASFVDDDELAASPDDATLCLFRTSG